MTNALRVIHLSTSHTGGAGIAARRLNAELNSLGFHSIFYALESDSYFCKFNEYKLKKKLRFLPMRVVSTLLAKITKKISFFSVYSAPGISISWLHQMSKNQPTVFHVHNWFNLFSIRQLNCLVKSGLPVVFTMHDQRLITGGCHNTLSCRQFMSGCTKCPEFYFPMRKIIKSNFTRFARLFDLRTETIAIITPSGYMHNEAKGSLIVQKQKLKFIPNVLGKDFYPINNIYQFDKMKINTPKKDLVTVGIANIDLVDPLKGGDLISELGLRIVEQGMKVKLLFLADFEAEKGLDFWNQIDCLLLPSRAENSPNVIHEAKFFGIPVIATSVGGIPELLTKNYDLELNLPTLSADEIFLAIDTIRSRVPSVQKKLESIKSLSMYSAGWESKLLSVYHDLLESVKI
jgi:glycosyltransferase involved in cell wall biosynthesis